MSAGQVLDTICTDRKILSQVSRETTREEMHTLGIVARLLTMVDAGWTGAIALSAIQIGVPIQVAVYIPNRIKPELSKDPVTIVNPKIIEFENLNFKSREGCISLPNQRFNTYRYQRICYTSGFDQSPRWVEGIEAQVVQHEIDHFNGILCDSRIFIQTRNERCACGSGLKFKKCHGK